MTTARASESTTLGKIMTRNDDGDGKGFKDTERGNFSEAVSYDLSLRRLMRHLKHQDE